MTEDNKKELVDNINMIKMLLVLLVDKLGVDKRDIAKALGISPGRLSQLLNPKKYKK
jgi:plasmid maintenance system antidote protein VapI